MRLLLSGGKSEAFGVFDLWADDVPTCPAEVRDGEVWVRVKMAVPCLTTGLRNQQTRHGKRRPATSARPLQPEGLRSLGSEAVLAYSEFVNHSHV